MSRRRKLKARGARGWTWRKKAGLALVLGLLGLALFWWHQAPPRVSTVAAKPLLAPSVHTNVLPHPVPALALNPPPVHALLETNASVPAKKPGPVLTPSPTQDVQALPAPLFPRPVRDAAEAQIALARLGISCGSIDGRLGPQTRLALQAFQRFKSLPPSGQLDACTRDALLLTRASLSKYVVTEADLKRLQPLSATWAGKAQQTAVDYETLLELVAEKSRAHPDFVRHLNPTTLFSSPLPAGTALTVPDTELGELTPCAFIKISLSARILEAFDSRSNLVAHFPCSIARRVEKRPVGELHVASIAPHPDYTFDPAVFPESAEARQIGHKLILPPGPNNPVGTAWIGLDRPGYGIHGTPLPEQVGRTESHGCFRLANWNADHLLQLVHIGTPVYIE